MSIFWLLGSIALAVVGLHRDGGAHIVAYMGWSLAAFSMSCLCDLTKRVKSLESRRP